jgi:hypothetical protein
MRDALLAVVLALALPACAAPRCYSTLDPTMSEAFFMPVQDKAEEEPGASPVEIGHVVLMYLPNRVLDVFDMARAGVNVGPGIGAQVKATDNAQVTYITRTSAGAGLQSLRHLPGYASIETRTGVGPLEAGGNLGIGWYQSPTDIRIELHPFLVGAHVAIDPVEIADFILGIFTVDIRKDDY